VNHGDEHEGFPVSGDPILKPRDESGSVVDLSAARRVRATRHLPDVEDFTDSGEVLVGEVVPVDPPVNVPGSFLAQVAAAERRPLVPSWLLSRDEFGQVVRWVAGYYTHVAAYHVLRTPKYGAKLALRSPRGLWRVLAASWRWVFDLEASPVRQAVVDRPDAVEAAG
jgi:S-DNA-T family DNA segregation ATPase FtsK/SpoIIIE